MPHETGPPLFAVIMAGGSGTRFWPASRRARPKQFLAVSGSRSMLVETVARLDGLVPLERTIVVVGARHEELVRSELPDLPAENLLVEPVGRNTLPCVAWAAVEVGRRVADSVQVVLPADHVIEPVESFRATVREAALAAADSSALFTFGIRPSYAATGYGYIELEGASAASALPAARRFVEKPDRERAQEFVASGRFLWNSGMFVWSTAAILAAIREHAPEVHAAFGAGADPRQAYPALPAISVDVGVMEKASDVRVLPLDYSWNDVGSWAALAEVHTPDADGNCSAGGGELVAEDSAGCVVYADPGSLTALIGVEDLIVVHAAGATLVCPRDRAEDVRRIVERLEGDAPDWL